MSGLESGQEDDIETHILQLFMWHIQGKGKSDKSGILTLSWPLTWKVKPTDFCKLDRKGILVRFWSLKKVDLQDEFSSSIFESIGDARGGDEQDGLLHLLDRTSWIG